MFAGPVLLLARLNRLNNLKSSIDVKINFLVTINWFAFNIRTIYSKKHLTISKKIINQIITKLFQLVCSNN